MSTVMEKITKDYDELKKAYEGMKCPKDDKIQALRSTARALETENELLLDEKKKIESHTMNMRAMYEQKLVELQKEFGQSKDELKQSVDEKARLIDQSEKMENETLTLRQQLNKCQKDLEAAKKQIEKVILGGIINLFYFMFWFSADYISFLYFLYFKTLIYNLSHRKRRNKCGESQFGRELTRT